MKWRINFPSLIGLFLLFQIGDLKTTVKIDKNLLKLDSKNIANGIQLNSVKLEKQNDKKIKIHKTNVKKVKNNGKPVIDPRIFNEKDNVGLALRQVYEVFTEELKTLKSRVANVEQVSNNILTRITAIDCSDLKNEPTEYYTFNMNHGGKRPVTVRCDQEVDGGGWTVIQQRLAKEEKTANLSTSFDRSWYDYKVGFGEVTGDYWIGLENIYIWTNTRHYELRIEIYDFQENMAYAQYKRFYIDSEQEGYKLHVSDFSGTAGDSLAGAGIPDNFTADGMMFSTKDRDNDSSEEINCSKYWKIGGWWFNRCSWANLNGPYLFPKQGDGTGINWHRWRNQEYLKSTIMMIRPAKTTMRPNT